MLLKEGYSLEQMGRIDYLVKRRFGVTKSFNLCGYILRDGAMVCLSHDGVNRDIDHNEIGGAAYGKNDNELTDFEFPSKYEFIALGNIRLFPMYGFQLCVPPTVQQEMRLTQFIKRCDSLYVDITDENGHTRVHFDYEQKPNAQLVLNKIKRYFEEYNDQPEENNEPTDACSKLEEALITKGKFDSNGEDDVTEYYGGWLYIYKVNCHNGGLCWKIDTYDMTSNAYGVENKFFADICKLADKHKVVLIMPIFKKGKMTTTMKSFGFKPNSGRNTNYFYNSYDWIREPKK